MSGHHPVSTKEFIDTYADDINKLLQYLPWLESKSGTATSSLYHGERNELTMAVPVYDSTLLNFIKLASNTCFIDKNYPYFFTREHIKTVNDEINAIRKADRFDFYPLISILSKYVLSGRMKGNIWSDGMNSGVYLEIVRKMHDDLQFWDKTALKENNTMY